MRNKVRVAIISIVAGLASMSQAIAGEMTARTSFQSDFGLFFYCALANGTIKQRLSDVVKGIPEFGDWGGWAVDLLVLSKGSGRCVAARLNGAGHWNSTSGKVPLFTHRLYDGNNTLLGSSGPRKCTVPEAVWCIPAPIKNLNATKMTACFELPASSGQPTKSVVLSVAIDEKKGPVQAIGSEEKSCKERTDW